MTFSTSLNEIAEKYPRARLEMIAARRVKGLTQVGMAARLNVSLRYYLCIEYGLVEKPEPDVMRRARKILFPEDFGG